MKLLQVIKITYLIYYEQAKTTLVDEDDDDVPSLAERMGRQNFQSEPDDYEIVELEDRLARHNIESSPEQAEGKKPIFL